MNLLNMSKVRAISSFILLLGFSAFIITCPFSKQISKLILLFSIYLWLSTLLLRMKQFLPLRFPEFRKKPYKPVLIFLAATVIAVICGRNPYFSQKLLCSRYSIYLAVLLMGYSLAKNKRGLIVLTGTIVFSALTIGFGCVRDQISLHPDRLFTCFGLKVFFTNYLALYIPILFSIVIFAKNKYIRLSVFAVLILLLFTLVFGLSRMTWFACLIALFFVALAKSERLFVAILIIFMILVIIMPMQIKMRGMTICDFNTTARFELWERAIRMLNSSPIFGVGPGMFEKLISEPQYKLPWDPSVLLIHTHNTFIEVLVETGLVGFCAYLYIFVNFFVAFAKSIKKNQHSFNKAILVGIAGAISASLILSFGTTVILVGLQDAVVFWFLLGVGYRLLEMNSL